MLVDSMLVTTVAVVDLEGAKAFYRDRLGLDLLEEGPFAIRFGGGEGHAGVGPARTAERGPDRRALRGG